MASALALKEDDLKLMLAAKVHYGTKNCDNNFNRYVWRRRQDGVYIINLGKTWEKLVLAARVIVAIENPADVIVISARPYGQRAVFKFAQHTGASYIGGRYTPGTFTNQQQNVFQEPRLLVATDPRTDNQPILEASYANIPCIAFCDSDANLDHVDICIPANNKGIHSLALMYWMLAREVLRMRATISRVEPWEIMVDLFMYRDPEEAEKAAAEAEVVAAEDAEVVEATPFAADAGKTAEWGAEDPAAAQWDAQAQAQAANWQAPAAPTGWEGQEAGAEAQAF